MLAFVAFAVPAADKPAFGTITGKVTISGAKHNGNAVVYLEELEEDAGMRPPQKHKMWQKEKQFSPQVLVVQKGDEVEFPNGDKLFHNVFSVSKPARFDLGLYKEGESKTVTFKRPGVVDVYCNIHPQMVGKVLIVPNQYFAETGADGTFKIEGVPPGDYEIVAWHPASELAEDEVEVSAGAKAELSFKLEPQQDAAPHTRKDGTPYGRYK